MEPPEDWIDAERRAEEGEAHEQAPSRYDFYINPRGAAPDDPSELRRVWPPCPSCGRPVFGDVTSVDGVVYHRSHAPPEEP